MAGCLNKEETAKLLNVVRALRLHGQEGTMPKYSADALADDVQSVVTMKGNYD